MPEVQEVFRMATEKAGQDPGALERQVERQRKAARNHRISVFAMVLVLVAATLAAYAYTRGGTRGVPANRATTSAPPGIGLSAMVDLNTGKITPLPASIATKGAYYAVSPDDTMVAFSSCCSHPDPLFVANIDGTGVRRVSAKGQDAYGAQWSPDGSMLVYQQRDASTIRLGNLYVLDVATGRRTRLTNFDQTQRWGWWFTFPSFAPDRDLIFFQLPRGDRHNPVWDLWYVPVAGGKPTLVRRNAGWGGLSPSHLGRNLAYLSPVNGDFSGGGLWITSFDLRGVTPRALVPEGHLSWPRWSPDGTRISYSDGGWIYVLNVATGSTTKVVSGFSTAEWFDDHTLIVGPGG